MELIEKTQLDKDIDLIISDIDTIKLAVSATVSTLNNAHSSFWGLPDDRFLTVINKIGPEKIQEMFNQHYAIGTACNDFLNISGNTSTRAIIVRGREIIVNNQGLFEFVPPQEI